MVKKVSFYLALLTIILTLAAPTWARTRIAPIKGQADPNTALVAPAFCMAEHNVGKMVLAVTNYGTFGDGFAAGSTSDCFTGLRVMSCEYPKGSRTMYNFASCFWFGAVVGRDTLVSVGSDGWNGGSFEMFPDEAANGGEMQYRSIMDPTDAEHFEGAISEQDYIGVYTDTFTSGVPGLAPDEVQGRPHVPLNIEVTQSSYAWSYPYAEDFILFDYGIRNIGTVRLRDVYMGVYVDADIMGANQQSAGYTDDLSGFLEEMNTHYGGGDWLDTINIAYISDNSGKLNSPPGSDETKVPHVVATRIVRTPSDSLEVSFNWWVSNGSTPLDFGPQHKDGVRDLWHGGLGTPSGDRNKYAFLSNGEFDYDQIYTADISPADPVWLYPSNQGLARDIADGFDTRYLLSFGPFNIDPGQTLPLSLAWVGGEFLHTDATNQTANLTSAYKPDEYYANLNFDSLALNSVWASWIYDNPGVDTDGDGYFGEFRQLCLDSIISEIIIIVEDPEELDTIWEYFICDTVWYKGDGVPDFRGASPPPAPGVGSVGARGPFGEDGIQGGFWAYPEVGRVRIRWNGLRSETTRDVFSRELDFEGYRVYLARDDREGSYSIQASYDREDYNKYIYNQPRDIWELKDVPFTIEDLRCLYGESCSDMGFDPSRNSSRSNPYLYSGFDGDGVPFDSIFYFEPQDFNRSKLGETTPIRKIYPDQPYPSSNTPDSAQASELTEDGFLKYYEYELVIENLLPTVPYWVSVTAMDYGSPQSGLASLETPKSANAIMVYPLPTTDVVAAEGLGVYVYPNPYVGDGAYAAQGFEGHDDKVYDASDTEYIRRIRFANLPAKCTIRIFSLDGDLISEFDHDVDPTDPTASVDSWNMITRNTQSVVSGIYYWTVEDVDGNIQIGKFVVIL